MAIPVVQIGVGTGNREKFLTKVPATKLEIEAEHKLLVYLCDRLGIVSPNSVCPFTVRHEMLRQNEHCIETQCKDRCGCWRMWAEFQIRGEVQRTTIAQEIL